MSEAKLKELEEAERAKATQALSAAPMKIPFQRECRQDDDNYLSNLRAVEGHTRIELLDPRWKSQRDSLEARRAIGNEQQLGANVVTSLKQLARAFVDDEADEVKRKQLEVEAEAKRKEREKIAWAGYTATKVGTVNKFQSNVNFDEQIASIWNAWPRWIPPADATINGRSYGRHAPLTFGSVGWGRTASCCWRNAVR
ncbi:hypothetical protein M407DRAFT_23288 [Tulasnella calospora MUT 4182]|uniref:Splicing factor 3A subunit 1 conserved domain-containing protein n=1 Tax=Tulasnella calospora MUT 4182 TaxID=1051891 RepID=A0A0C3L180_9AGAM|nr:hypothetical protein M407DRAFT_23288 [Tulasnella calospora MUT 4182]